MPNKTSKASLDPPRHAERKALDRRSKTDEEVKLRCCCRFCSWGPPGACECRQPGEEAKVAKSYLEPRVAQASMCFTTYHFPEQASDFFLVNKINHSLGLDKERLYVGLYVRGSAPKMPGGEDESVCPSALLNHQSSANKDARYHWAFLAGPKQHPKSGSRHIMYHAKERLVKSGNPPQLRPEWQYVNDSDRAAMLLIRVVVGKIINRDRLEQIFRDVPLRTDDPDWNCVLWMEDAFQRILGDGHALASSVKDWESVRCQAMWYVSHKKAAHRFDGKDSNTVLDPMKPATWDMLRNLEMTP